MIASDLISMLELVHPETEVFLADYEELFNGDVELRYIHVHSARVDDDGDFILNLRYEDL